MLAEDADDTVPIVKEGAVTPLIGVLCDGSPYAREDAVHTLAILAEDAGNKVTIVKEGAVAPLIGVLRDGYG